MIRPEHLVAALGRLDPRHREVLELSLRRRVPDEALAKVYDVEAAEVARRRAGAIERLSDELGLQRGEDLGQVLKALLEHETWEPLAREREAEARPVEEELQRGPVLELLAERRQEERSEESISRDRWSGVLAAAAGVLAALAAGGVVALALSRDDDDGRPVDDDGPRTRLFVPQEGGPRAAPFPSDPEAASEYLTALVDRPTVLLDRPGGERKVRIRAQTEWGSPRVLGVVERRGEWIAVQLPELPNGEVGWLRSERATLDSTPWSLHADLSRRRLEVRRSGETVRTLEVAIGSPEHPTPTGRFSVTDKLRVTDRDSVYGCCVLALSGHQVKLPPDWPGGDRLAVHATTDTETIGQPISLGCMRTVTDHARWLIETVPLGSPVFVRS